MQIHIREIVSYRVSALPADHRDARHFTITVEQRGDRWALTHSGAAWLRGTGDWEIEPLPSERDEEYRNLHYFQSADAALALAKELAPTLIVNGFTVEAILAR